MFAFLQLEWRKPFSSRIYQSFFLRRGSSKIFSLIHFLSAFVPLSLSSSLRVAPSLQQFIIITSPQSNGAHLRLIMCHTYKYADAHTHTHEWDPLKPYYMSDCASNMGDYPSSVCSGRGQELQVRHTNTGFYTGLSGQLCSCAWHNMYTYKHASGTVQLRSVYMATNEDNSSFL